MIDIHQNMPISLILTQFDYFQIPPSFAVTPNLILEPRLTWLTHLLSFFSPKVVQLLVSLGVPFGNVLGSI